MIVSCPSRDTSTSDFEGPRLNVSLDMNPFVRNGCVLIEITSFGLTYSVRVILLLSFFDALSRSRSTDVNDLNMFSAINSVILCCRLTRDDENIARKITCDQLGFFGSARKRTALRFSKIMAPSVLDQSLSPKVKPVRSIHSTQC